MKRLLLTALLLLPVLTASRVRAEVTYGPDPHSLNLSATSLRTDLRTAMANCVRCHASEPHESTIQNMLSQLVADPATPRRVDQLAQASPAGQPAGAIPDNGPILTIELNALPPDQALELARTLFQANGAAAGPNMIAVRVPDAETADRLRDELSKLDRLADIQRQAQRDEAAKKDENRRAIEREVSDFERKYNALTEMKQPEKAQVQSLLTEGRELSKKALDVLSFNHWQVPQHDVKVQHLEAMLKEMQRGDPVTDVASAQRYLDTLGLANQLRTQEEWGSAAREQRIFSGEMPGTDELKRLLEHIQSLNGELTKAGPRTTQNAEQIDNLTSHRAGATRRWEQLHGQRQKWIEAIVALATARRMAAENATATIRKQREQLELDRARLLGQGVARDDERVRKLDAEVAELARQERESIEAEAGKSIDVQYATALEQRARLLAEGAAEDDERVKQLSEQIAAWNTHRIQDAEERMLAEKKLLEAAQNPLRLEIAKLEAELSVLMQTRGDGHAQVQELRTRINSLRSQLPVNGAQGNPLVALERTRSQIATLQEQIAQLESQRRAFQERGMLANADSLNAQIANQEKMVQTLNQSLLKMEHPGTTKVTRMGQPGRDGKSTVMYETFLPLGMFVDLFKAADPNREYRNVATDWGSKIQVTGNQQVHIEFLELLKKLLKERPQERAVLPVTDMTYEQLSSLLNSLFASEALDRRPVLASSPTAILVYGTVEQLHQVHQTLASMTGPAAPEALQLSKDQIGQLRQQFQAAEAAALAQAEQLKALKGNALENPQAGQLREEVTKAFEARQAQQRAEVQALQQRVQSLQQSLDAREKEKQRIIDKRVEELLNPNLKWETSRKALEEQAARSIVAAPLPAGAETNELLGLWEYEKTPETDSGFLPSGNQAQMAFTQYELMWFHGHKLDDAEVQTYEADKGFQGKLKLLSRSHRGEPSFHFEINGDHLKMRGEDDKLMTYRRVSRELSRDLLGRINRAINRLSAPSPYPPSTVPPNASTFDPELLGVWQLTHRTQDGKLVEAGDDTRYAFLPKRVAVLKDGLKVFESPYSITRPANDISILSMTRQSGAALTVGQYTFERDSLFVRWVPQNGDRSRIDQWVFRRFSRSIPNDLLNELAETQQPSAPLRSAAPAHSGNFDPELLGVWETVNVPADQMVQYVITPTKYAAIHGGEVVEQYSLRTSRLTEGNRIAELFGPDGKTRHIIKYVVEGNTLRWTLPAVDGEPEHPCSFERISATVGPAYEKLLAEAESKAARQEPYYNAPSPQPAANPSIPMSDGAVLVSIVNDARNGTTGVIFDREKEATARFREGELIQVNGGDLKVRELGETSIVVEKGGRQYRLAIGTPISKMQEIGPTSNDGMVKPAPEAATPAPVQLAAGPNGLDILALTNQATSFRVTFQELAAEIPKLQGAARQAKVQQFEAYKDQYTATLRLVEQQIQQIKGSLLDVAKQRYELVNLQVQSGMSSQSELVKVQGDLLSAESQLQMAVQVLELLKKAAPPELPREAASMQPVHPQTAADHAQLKHSQENAKRIMLALHLYHDKHGHFPPAVVMNQAGTVPHSWRVEILPHLGQAEQALFAEYRMDEPWDSEHNKKLLEKMPDLYRAPGDDPKSVNASYFGLGNPVPDPYYVDKRRVTLFNGASGAKISDARDGTSNALAVVECKRDIPWTKPEDIDYSTSKPVPPLGGWHKDAFIGGRVDGAALVYSGSNDEATLRKLIEIDDGQPVKPKTIDVR